MLVLTPALGLYSHAAVETMLQCSHSLAWFLMCFAEFSRGFLSPFSLMLAANVTHILATYSFLLADRCVDNKSHSHCSWKQPWNPFLRPVTYAVNQLPVGQHRAGPSQWDRKLLERRKTSMWLSDTLVWETGAKKGFGHQKTWIQLWQLFGLWSCASHFPSVFLICKIGELN